MMQNSPSVSYTHLTLFTQEKHLARKAAEMFAALAIEKQYNKEQIFEMYVNIAMNRTWLFRI